MQIDEMLYPADRYMNKIVLWSYKKLNRRKRKMIENRDGNFGDIMSSDELLKKIREGAIGPEVKAIHFGNEAELERLQGELNRKKDELAIAIEKALVNTTEARLDSIERNINRIMIHLGIDDKTKVLKF